MLSSMDGSVCVSRLRAARLLNTGPDALPPPSLELILDHMDWNGSHCGLTQTRAEIREFREPKLVTKLAVYPLNFAENQEEIRHMLVARGRKFESLRGFQVMSCTGEKMVMTSDMMGSRNVVKPVGAPSLEI